MVKNKEFLVYSVGATIGRPPEIMVNRGGELKEAPANNNH